MVGWHHRLDGHEFEQAPEDGEGQGSLVCCSSGDHKELDTAERLNNNSIFGCAGSSLLAGFSPVVGSRGHYLAVVHGSHCSGFFCCGARALGCAGLGNCSTWVQ